MKVSIYKINSLYFNNLFFNYIIALEENPLMKLSSDNIIIKKSILVPTEYGAFAKKNLKPNQHIGYYCGKVMKTVDNILSYKTYLDKTHVMDASHITSCHARFINDSTCGIDNVKFVISNVKNTEIQKKLK